MKIVLPGIPQAPHFFLVFLEGDPVKELLENHEAWGTYASVHQRQSVVLSEPLRGQMKEQTQWGCRTDPCFPGGHRGASREGGSSILYLLGQASPLPVWFATVGAVKEPETS